MMTEEEAEAVVATAVRLTEQHGPTKAALEARKWARYHGGGTEGRRFWLDVAESIEDAAPKEDTP